MYTGCKKCCLCCCLDGKLAETCFEYLYTAVYCCILQLREMEQKLQDCRAKAGLVADVAAQSSVEG